MKNRNGETTMPTPPVAQRPVASDTEIRAMRDKAAGHQVEANKYETSAQHEIANAERMASDMVANAQAEAARIVHEAQAAAAAHERQADERAKGLRAKAAAEESAARYWVTLATEESVRAGLPSSVGQVPVTGPFEAAETFTDGRLDTSGATS